MEVSTLSPASWSWTDTDYPAEEQSVFRMLPIEMFSVLFQYFSNNSCIRSSLVCKKWSVLFTESIERKQTELMKLFFSIPEKLEVTLPQGESKRACLTRDEKNAIKILPFNGKALKEVHNDYWSIRMISDSESIYLSINDMFTNKTLFTTVSTTQKKIFKLFQDVFILENGDRLNYWVLPNKRCHTINLDNYNSSMDDIQIMDFLLLCNELLILYLDSSKKEYRIFQQKL